MMAYAPFRTKDLPSFDKCRQKWLRYGSEYGEVRGTSTTSKVDNVPLKFFRVRLHEQGTSLLLPYLT